MISVEESFLITLPVVTTYTDATVTNGVTYYYQVSATNAIGEGPWSSEASATPTTPAWAPRGLSAMTVAAPVSLTLSTPTSHASSPVTHYRACKSTPSGAG